MFLAKMIGVAFLEIQVPKTQDDTSESRIKEGARTVPNNAVTNRGTLKRSGLHLTTQPETSPSIEVDWTFQSNPKFQDK